MAENDDSGGKDRSQEKTPTPPKKRTGRPKGGKNGEPLKVTQRYQISLTEAARGLVDPATLLEFDLIILQGYKPVFVKDGKGGYKCIPDPNPLATSPTLNDQRQSQQNLLNRGHGLPVSNVQIEANIKAQALAFGIGIDNQSLLGLDANTLFAVRDNLAKLFQLPAPETDNSDAIDAEFTEIKENSPLPEGDSGPLSEDKEE